MKSILVFSHNHNSFDKKVLLHDAPNQFVNVSNIRVEEFVKENDIRDFFMRDIDKMLDSYQDGRPENKPDVLKQMDDIKKSREKRAEKRGLIMNDNKINEMTMIINELLMENNQLKDKVDYLEKKITKLIAEKIEERKKNANK
jgi:hypothetical protein